MKKKQWQSIGIAGLSSGKEYAIKIEKERQLAIKKSNPPDNGNCFCDRCEEWSMEEKGTIYHCDVCENWHYSSS